MIRPPLAFGVVSVFLAFFAGLSAQALAATPPDTNRAGETTLEAGGAPEAVAALRDIVARQKAALAEGKAKTEAVDLEDVRPKLQRVIDDYERLLTRYPNFAAGWAAYGLFLCDPLVEDHKTALALLLKANGLDGEIPVVKNQIGVILAEQGRAIDALNYFLAAADLAPAEPLYHFQIGLVLAEGRADFQKSKAWTPAVIDRTLLDAFARAVSLAPERTDFAYRAAESYYDLAEPRWEEAYRAWTRLEQLLEGRLETQTVRLHRARTLWKQGLAGDARELLATVDASELAGQRAKLAAEFDADDAAEKTARERPVAPVPAAPPALDAEAKVAFPAPVAPAK